jgi:hypothetical protein
LADSQINLLDTPGHQDFSEDTYRTLAAADNAVMLVGGSQVLDINHVTQLLVAPSELRLTRLNGTCQPVAMSVCFAVVTACGQRGIRVLG